VLNADTWLRGEGVVTVRRRVHDWVRAADKLVSGGVSLLDGAHPARPSVAEAGKRRTITIKSSPTDL